MRKNKMVQFCDSHGTLVNNGLVASLRFAKSMIPHVLQLRHDAQP